MPWRIKEVIPRDNYCLDVIFLDGTKGIVDMAKLIMSQQAGIFDVLRDTKLFNQVYLNYGAVTWPGDIDLAPDAMYYEIKKNGKWIID